MPLFGPLNYGALYPTRRAFGLDQFLPADQELARRGYPLYGSDSGSVSGGGSPPAADYKPPNEGSGGGDGDLMRQRDQWPAGGGYGLPLGQGLPPKAGAGAGPPNAGGPFPTLGLQTTRRTQLFGPLANLSAPQLF